MILAIATLLLDKNGLILAVDPTTTELKQLIQANL
jgi:hypothetical protein